MATMSNPSNPRFIGRKLVAVIAGTELIIMLIADWINVQRWFTPTQFDFIDTAILSITASFVIFYWVIKPLKASSKTIEEYKSLEKMLLASERQYRNLFENNPQPMLIYARDSLSILAANDTAVDRYGYSREEFLSMKVTDLHRPEEHAAVVASIAQLTGEIRRPGNWRHKKKDGTMFDVDIITHEMVFNGIAARHVLINDITLKKAAEDQLFETKRDWEETFNTISDMITVHDKNLNIIRSNKAAQVILGLPFLEVSQVKCYEYYHGTSCPPEGCPSCQSLKTGQPTTAEFFEPHLNKFIEIRAIPRFDAHNQLIGLIHIVRDIGERKKAEKVLVNHARQTALGADVGASLTRSTDLHGALQFCAESLVKHLDVAFARIWTLNEKERVLELQASAGLYTHITGPHASVPIGGVCYVGLIAREKMPYLTNAVIGDTRIGNPDWAIHEGIVSFAGYPLIVGDKLVGVIAMFSKEPLHEQVQTAIASIADEIALGIERMRMDEVLKVKEARLRILVETIPDLIWLKDADGIYLICNKVCEQFFGAKETDIVGKTDYDFVGKELADFLRDHDRKAIAAGKPTSSIEWAPFLSDGHRVLLNTIKTPMYDAEGKLLGLLSIGRDITEFQKLEDQLRHAQKMEGIGTLAGGIAHDFNNILSAIVGYGHITLMKMQQDDPLRMNIEHILESADRAAALTRSLLTFSRKQVIERKPVELNSILIRVEKFLMRVIGEDVVVRVVPAEGDLTIFADAGQLEQVLMNLATNARDAMPNGGLFTLETSITTLDRSFAAAHGFGETGTYALISATDTGVGMTEETRKKIFEPFFTTKEVGKGTGLGMAIVYGIIKQHEGFINVYSEPGKGTTFRIYLPLIKTKVMEECKIIAAEYPKGGTETVLLAEDDATVRELTLLVLEQMGYTVIVAHDGAEAVTKFKENKDRIQLLLFDIIMPKKNGREAYEEIKKMKPDIPVIFASGYSPDMISDKALIEKGAAIVYKPLSPLDLSKKVREVLDRKR